MLKKPERRIDRFATDRWIDKLQIPRACKALLRYLVSRVDSRTGASHPRFPILQSAISMAISYSIAHVCRTFNALEDFGVVLRQAMKAKRKANGTIGQLPTDYQLALPDECWREIKPVESTPIARVHEPAPVVPVAPAPSRDWTLTVHGRLSERDAAARTPIARWNLDPRADHTFIDGMHFVTLAPKLLDAAKLASEGAPDELRTRVLTCLHELRTRANEVALLCTNATIASWDAVHAVRAWVKKCLLDPSRRVDSAEHSMNILRKFVREQADELYSRERKEQRRREREELAREHEVESSRASICERTAHIAIGYSRPVESSTCELDEACIESFPW